jgi:cyclic beta-1,2-glucan synthetase
MYRLGLEAILGFQRRGDKLRIEPSIPEAWPGFSLRYRYKTSRYAIQVENPDRLQSGVAQIWLDDRRLEGVELPLEDDGQEHHVRIRMGQSKD